MAMRRSVVKGILVTIGGGDYRWFCGFRLHGSW